MRSRHSPKTCLTSDNTHLQKLKYGFPLNACKQQINYTTMKETTEAKRRRLMKMTEGEDDGVRVIVQPYEDVDGTLVCTSITRIYPDGTIEYEEIEGDGKQTETE